MQDIASERAVLACICQYGINGFAEVSELVKESTLDDQNNKILFKILTTCLQHQEQIDLSGIISTANELKLKSYIEKDDNLRYIRSLMAFPIKLENVAIYAKKLKKLEIAREARLKHKIAYDELSNLTGKESIDEILTISERPVTELYNNINEKQEGPQLIWEGGEEYIQSIADNPVENIGIPTPWPIFNAAIGGGLRRGGVTLIGARPKQGKSVCSKDCGLHVSKKLGYPVLYLDTEMQKNQQLLRVLAGLSRIDMNRIETGKFAKSEIERERVMNAVKQHKEVPFYHVSIAGKPFKEIQSIIRRWILRCVGYDGNGRLNDCLVIYDYFKLMDESALKEMEEYQALGFQVSHLSDFANIMDFPVLAFVQLNRDGVTKETSDIISQSDRLLWLCQSFSILKRKTDEEIATDGPACGNTKLIPLECRFGAGLETGDYINLKFEKNISSMIELNSRNLAKKTNKSGFDVDGHKESESSDSE